MGVSSCQVKVRLFMSNQLKFELVNFFKHFYCLLVKVEFF